MGEEELVRAREKKELEDSSSNRGKRVRSHN
ncbi:hypothetical protein A2U01_0084897, partial [Trifolium medium]|nr:hypothetical protein [Trifolium medium]